VMIGDINPAIMADVDIKGVVVSYHHHFDGRFAGSGMISDATGTVKFVLLNGTPCIPLEVGMTVVMAGAYPSEYNGVLGLLLNKLACVLRCDETIEVKPFKQTLIADAQPGVIDLHALVVRVNTSHAKAKYLLTLSDSSGSCFGAVWDKSLPDVPALVEGKSVFIRYALASRRPDGSLSLDLSHAVIEESGEEIDAKIGRDVTAFVTDVREAKFVQRCVICNRPLKIQGTELVCDDHGSQSECLDLIRVKCRIDTGSETWLTYLNEEAVKSLLGVDNASLIRMCEKSPLREGLLLPYFKERLLFKRVNVTGDFIQDVMFARSAEFCNVQVAPGQAALIPEEVHA
jgi:hypothetical protein